MGESGEKPTISNKQEKKFTTIDDCLYFAGELYKGLIALSNQKHPLDIRKGVMGIFPEAGAWAHYLCPARPGAAYLSALSGAPLLPVGLVNMTEVFPSLRKFKRQKITIRIGKPFGPLHFNGKGKPSRKLLDDFGHEIMRRIAALIQSKQGGIYSSDPKVREAAKGTERYPWEGVREGVDEYKAL